MNYIESHFKKLSDQDYQTLLKKNKEYGDAWYQSYEMGLTQGVFQLIYEKFKRIQTQCSNNDFDIFKSLITDTRKEGILDDIKDLRNYLYLVECKHLEIKRKIKDLNNPYAKEQV